MSNGVIQSAPVLYNKPGSSKGANGEPAPPPEMPNFKTMVGFFRFHPQRNLLSNFRRFHRTWS